jgi:hypothetical protein
VKTRFIATAIHPGRCEQVEKYQRKPRQRLKTDPCEDGYFTSEAPGAGRRQKIGTTTAIIMTGVTLNAIKLSVWGTFVGSTSVERFSYRRFPRLEQTACD